MRRQSVIRRHIYVLSVLLPYKMLLYSFDIYTCVFKYVEYTLYSYL